MTWTPEKPEPGQAIAVEAEVESTETLQAVALLYRVAVPGKEEAEIALPMEPAAGNRYHGVIPGQVKDRLVRFRIRATGQTGASRFYPSEHEPRPALSAYVNNYFTYHDLRGAGKWTIYPWDEDQTWGVVGMMMDGDGGDVFHTMPLTFGMNGDRPPGMPAGVTPEGPFGFGFGGAPWWRQPGWFSGPLLANSNFRQIFLARLKHLLDDVYNEQVFLPIIDQMGERLKPEVRFRAELLEQDPGQAVRDLDRRLDRVRTHLRERRAFLLAQDELVRIGN